MTLREEIQEALRARPGFAERSALYERIDSAELKAELYDKLKALHAVSDLSEWVNLWRSNNLDAAVKALPNPVS